jgi:hypothetical protein
MRIPYLVPVLVYNPNENNGFVYVQNSPVNYSDSKGLFFLIDCPRCLYYYRKCANDGKKCKKKKCENDPFVTPSELFTECFQKTKSCQKMIKSCGKCGVGPRFPGPRPRLPKI